MTMTQAANELDAIRNNRSDDAETLAARVDAIGFWLASQKKTTKLLMKLLAETSQLHDKLTGGSGKSGVRIAC